MSLLPSRPRRAFKKWVCQHSVVAFSPGFASAGLGLPHFTKKPRANCPFRFPAWFVIESPRPTSVRTRGPATMATVNAVVERGCSMLVHFDRAASSSEIREALESGGPEAKAEAMKKAIAILLSGEQMPQIFITIVRFVLPSDDKYVQKLLLLYMEIIEKTDSSGKLLPEMILICQNLRNNLQHPNEFLRGATLRFLCRITEAEILEPLVPSIVACLEHRHSFVRRNAVLCIDRIYQMPGGDMLLQDAPETIERFLAGGESDLSTRRNAFLMLYNNDQDRAVSFLLQNVEQVANWGDILQNVVLDLIRKVRALERTRGESRPRSRPARPLFALFHSPRASSPTRKTPTLTVCPYDPVYVCVC